MLIHHYLSLLSFQFQTKHTFTIFGRESRCENSPLAVMLSYIITERGRHDTVWLPRIGGEMQEISLEDVLDSRFVPGHIRFVAGNQVHILVRINLGSPIFGH
ncbi:hypothetical protein RchiOBHm_Chr7g0198381 [Rosa chinensis]|uniref:Uncharacterized protein n=1 Tax=Rosa chinensis TaxID=74649 RepID=A0A2P6P747_ROSCH|nr:hypothetical protein RchiOBHm_Chr7g0198381 [Rosa chinensis]